MSCIIEERSLEGNHEMSLNGWPCLVASFAATCRDLSASRFLLRLKFKFKTVAATGSAWPNSQWQKKRGLSQEANNRRCLQLQFASKGLIDRKQICLPCCSVCLSFGPASTVMAIMGSKQGAMLTSSDLSIDFGHSLVKLFDSDHLNEGSQSLCCSGCCPLA